MYWHKIKPYYNDLPWTGLNNLQWEFSNFLRNDRVTTGTSGFPAVNAWSNEDGIQLIAELPGADPDEVNVSVKENSLTLSGTLMREVVGEGEEWHRHERREGDFLRTFSLPFKVESEKVVADYKDGLLTVTLPRSAYDRPNKIEIKTS